MRRMHFHFFRGSHLPVLMKVVGMTTGPILELGSGVYSTTFLHWSCLPTKRRLVTYENNPQYYGYVELSRADFHEVHTITDWDAVDVSAPWTVAFVDHDPEPERYKLVDRLGHAEYVIAHDTERRRNGFEPVFSNFKYRFDYRDAGRPHTTLLSNVHDLKDFAIP